MVVVFVLYSEFPSINQMPKALPTNGSELNINTVQSESGQT